MQLWYNQEPLFQLRINVVLKSLQSTLKKNRHCAGVCFQGRNLSLVDTRKIFWPPFNSHKIGLMTNFLKALNKEGEWFRAFRKIFPRITDAKIKVVVFVGPISDTLHQWQKFEDVIMYVAKDSLGPIRTLTMSNPHVDLSLRIQNHHGSGKLDAHIVHGQEHWKRTCAHSSLHTTGRRVHNRYGCMPWKNDTIQHTGRCHRRRWWCAENDNRFHKDMTMTQKQ